MPFVALAAVPAVVLAVAGASALAVVSLVLPLAVALFFRDPDRAPTSDGRAVLAPADGKVMFAGEAPAGAAPSGAWRQVTIFLSLLDVHINRTPVAGRVTRVDYVPGTFVPAYRDAARKNEHSEIWIEHGGQTIICRQVVGVLARRILCRIGEGAEVTAGQRYGIMKFGSRMDVFLPPDAMLKVSVGDKVVGGETVIATLA